MANMLSYNAETVFINGALHFDRCPWEQGNHYRTAKFMVTAAHTRGLRNIGYVTPEARFWFHQGRPILHNALFRVANRGCLIRWRPQDPQLLPLLRNDHTLLDRPDAVRIINHVIEAIAHYEEEFARIHGHNVDGAAAVPVAPVVHAVRSENVPSVPGAAPRRLPQPDDNAGRVHGRTNTAILQWTLGIPHHGPQGGSHVLPPANQGAAPGTSAVNAITIDDGGENTQHIPGAKRAGKRPLRNDSGSGGSGSTAGNAIFLDDESEIRHARPAAIPIVLPAAYRGDAAAYPFAVPSSSDNSAEIKQARPASAPAALSAADQGGATTPLPLRPSTSNGSSENVRKRRRNGPATFPGLQDRFTQGQLPQAPSKAYHLGLAIPTLRRYAWQTLEGKGMFDPPKVEKKGRKRNSKSPDKATVRAARKALDDAAAANSSASSPATSSPVENGQQEPAAAEPVDIAMADVGPEYEEGSLEAMLEAALQRDEEPDEDPADDVADSGELIVEDPEEVRLERVRRLEAAAQDAEDDSLEADLMRALNS